MAAPRAVQNCNIFFAFKLIVDPIDSNTHNPHPLVVRPVVLVPRLVERVLPIVPGQIPGKPDQHLAQRWVHVEEERPVDVPAAHLAKVRLVPANVVRDGHIVKPGAHRQHEDRPEQDPPVAGKKKRRKG